MIESPTITLTESQQRALENLPPRVADALSRFRDNLLARFPGQILRVILYGSFARGETHGESDVDVMVVVGWELPKLPDGSYLHPSSDPRCKAIGDLAYEATLKCGRFISDLVVDESLFRKGRDAIREARREGIELYHHPSVCWRGDSRSGWTATTHSTSALIERRPSKPFATPKPSSSRRANWLKKS